MIEPPQADSLLEIARNMMDDEGGMNPVLFYNSGEYACITPCEDMHPARAMAGIAAGVRLGRMQQPDWIAIATDAYYAKTVDREEMETLYQTSLKEQYEAGNPMVGESLMVTCVSKVGTIFCVRQGYIREGETIVWDDPEDLVEQADGSWDGRMVQAMEMLLGIHKGEK